MTTATELLIVLENATGGRAWPVARVRDRALLRMAVATAIEEKRAECRRVAGEDEALKIVMDAEVRRLEQVLRALVPDAATDAAPVAA